MNSAGRCILVILAATLLAVPAALAEPEPGDCEPRDLSVNLNTGWDQSTGGSVFADGDPDDDWDVTLDASAGPVPRAADVTDGVGAWLTFPGSEWITAQFYGPAGFYEYEMCWCMDDDATDPVLDFQIRADNSANIFLNGNFVGALGWTTFNDPIAPAFTVSDPSFFNVGTNCLTVIVQNGGGPTGMNLVGGVTATDGRCCECVEMPSDIEAWWPLGEATGPTAFDIVSAHDGTHTDNNATLPSPTPAAGYVLGSLDFDGVDDVVVVPDDPGLAFGPNEDLTIDAWVNTENPLRQVIVGKKRPGINPGFSWGTALGILGMEISDGTDYVTCLGSTALDDGDWHFVAVTLDRDDPAGLRLYVDGVLDAECDPTPVDPFAGSLVNVESLYIGGDPLQGPLGAAWWRGRLDEIELFRRALGVAEVEELYLAGTSGKCLPIPCGDSTGVPVCEGTCPSGSVCDYATAGSDPCACVPETVPCTDSAYPVCNGDCPIGMTCQQGLAQDCDCVAIQGPCQQSPYPECNGVCPQGGTCLPGPVPGQCDCFLPVACEQTPYPACDGECPPGWICTQGLLQDCDCRPEPRCGDPGDYPTCEGPCPAGSTCDWVPGTQECDCFEDAPACSDTVYPECAGVCPPGEKCVNPLGTDDCECEPVPPPCGDPLYPACEGECPVDQRCVELLSGLPGCECVDCGTLGTSGLDDGIEIAWPAAKDRLRWTPATCALWYNAYRLTAARLSDAGDDGVADDYGSCYEPDVIETEAADSSSPPAGQLHWYLVTGENFAAEGSLGRASNGATRPNQNVCP